MIERVGSAVTRHRRGQRVVVNPLAGGNNIGHGGALGAFGPELVVRDVDAADSAYKRGLTSESLPF